ncbi:hypothetical protein [Zavarzinia aquatilis]|uniref:Porin domain-containing protein n=1 Tax=Zavarzinia aquatilis TaxID=2211142 RepID=A0A317E191_9PROT|nr:hypothetical protein [Zavarzinia aquatilis]PWR20411.1 hypothetical protein DKG74_15520 [Zavarzinia aquatilis]
MKSLSFLAGGIALLAPLAAFADGSFPMLNSETSLEVQNDGIVRNSDKATGTYDDMHLKVEQETGLFLTPEFGIKSQLVLEPLMTPDGDRFFANNGLYLEQLYAQYRTDVAGIYAGKFDPLFGRAYDNAPGIYGTDFAGDYELTEADGVGGIADFGNDRVGHYELKAAAFTLDTTFLSESLFTRPNGTNPRTDRPRRFTRDQGGLYNTGDLNNFTADVNMFGLAAIPDLTAYVSFESLGNGTPGAARQTGVAAGAEYAIDLGDDVSLVPRGEYAHFDNVDGDKATNADYVTASVELDKGPWDVAVIGGIRKFNSTDPAADYTDHLREISAGYTFENGMKLEVSAAGESDAGTDATLIGAKLSWSLRNP